MGQFKVNIKWTEYHEIIREIEAKDKDEAYNCAKEIYEEKSSVYSTNTDCLIYAEQL